MQHQANDSFPLSRRTIRLNDALSIVTSFNRMMRVAAVTRMLATSSHAKEVD
jgi:hypothetical protein